MSPLPTFQWNEALAYISTPVIFWMFISLIVLGIFSVSYNPALNAILDAPLLNCIGMKYGNIYASVRKLKLRITDVVLTPSSSTILKHIFLTLFPGGNVMPSKNSVDFPESKIIVGKITIKARFSSLARSLDDLDDGDNATGFPSKEEKDDATIQKEFGLLGWSTSLNQFLPRPVIVIILHNVTLHVEKVYIAPKPPPKLIQHAKKTASATSNDKDDDIDYNSFLPVAIPIPSNDVANNDDDVKDLPMFDQDYFWEMIRDEGSYNAESLTFYIERWIDHAVTTKLRKKGRGKEEETSSIHSKADISFSPRNMKAESNDEKVSTYDEKFNSWISFFVKRLCHHITFDLINASVIISGAGSEYVKKTREKYPPRQGNLKLAKLPKHRRAVTVFGSDRISLSFSPDSQCNLLGCFVGAYLKVGNPLSNSTNPTDSQYSWHQIVDPFQCVAELKGVIPFLIYSLSYDQYWETRSLELDLLVSEQNLILSPTNIHTVLLHLETYADFSCPLYQWLEWLRRMRSEVLKLTPEQKVAYCNNYARVKTGMEVDESEDIEDQHLLTPNQLNQMEMAMDEWEILSLRCFAMRKHWLIPKGNKEFSEFLRNTKSSISFKSDIDIDSLTGYVDSPFQRVYPTPLHALLMLVSEKSSILAPQITFAFSAGEYVFDFPSDTGEIDSGEDTPRKAIPSFFVSSGVRFRFNQSNPVFQRSESFDTRRSSFDLSLQVAGLRWVPTVGENDEITNELPYYQSNHPVGIIYEAQKRQNTDNVFSIMLGYSISPTIDSEAHFDVSLETSDLVVVVNPLPLVSSFELLLELLSFPSQPQMDSDESSSSEDDIGRSILSISSNLNASVRNLSFLFVIDRKRTNRGILDFHANKIDMDLNTGGDSGKLTLLAGPFELSAGRVAHYQSHLFNKYGNDASFRERFRGIEYSLMPFKPIMYIEGVEVFASGETEATRKNKSATTETSTLVIGLEMNTDHFTINASPSTIVAIRGVISSFDPFLSRLQGNPEEEALKARKMSEENERKNVEIQRQVMKRIFSEIDKDGSGIISGEEFDQLVVMLWNEARGGFTLTEDERQRETKYLVSMVDRSRSKEVTLQDLDDALEMLAGNIDDNNPVSKSKIIDDNFATSDEFLSSSKLRQLIYFEDLREYASMHKVNEMIGEMDIESGDFSFTSPSLWLQGRGVDFFWDFYTKETGCSRSSMKGKDMSAVQRRLVRSLCNYEFARFCWKTIVQPELRAGGSEKTTTQWLLDNNTYTLYRSGVINLLVDHVSRMAKESIEETQNKAPPKSTCEYALSLTAAIKSASVKFGSSHEFAKPLLETSLTNVSLNTSALLLGDGTFVETRESGDDDHAESYGNNVLQFQGTMSAKYLNTKHSHMECFLEPYPYFGRVTHHAFVSDPLLHPQISKAASPKTWSVKVDCPRFFSINTSPSLFETGSVITDIIGRTDPESHRTFLYQRDITFIQNFWDANLALHNGLLDRDSVLDVLCNTTDAHWQQEFQGMSSDEKRQLLGKFIDMAIGSDIEGLISFDDVKSWFRAMTSRCYFTGVEEIQIHNDSGMQLKVTSKSNFDKQRSRHSVMNEASFQVVVNSFQPIRNGNAGAIFLKDKHTMRNSQKKKPVLCGNLSMYLSGFRLLENVAVDPYQTLMFKLKMRKGLHGRPSRRRNARGVSGFQPYLTVVPKSSSLDTITLYVRSNVVIRSEVPVKIRIVRLGKSAGQFSKQGLQKRNKKSIDLTKKYLMTALNRAVEGAPIVFEAMCNGEGDTVALPLSVLTSNRFHAILIQDMSGKARNAWRPPLLFTRDFLFNPMNIRDVSRYHTMSGVVIQKERLDVQNAGKRSLRASSGDPKRNILRRTAWDVTILVVPFFLCMNTLPFPITIRAWQYAIDDEDDDWDGTAALLVDPEDTNELSSSDDESEMTPSINNPGINGDLYHLSTIDNSDYYYEGVVKVGQTLRLSGIKLSQPLFIQVSQHLENFGAAASLIWTNPVQMDLQKLQSGMNRKGSRSLPKLILDLGDNCDCLVDVSLDRDSKMPFCTFYSPYWVINKTGMKLEYSVSGANDKRYLDSGTGGLPVCMHCSKSEETNAILDKGSRQLSVIPLECPSEEVMKNWWDEEINGKLVLKRNGILDVTDWPRQPINLVAAGTNGEVHCDCFVLEARVESLAGTFHRSNLIKLTPRFIVKNTLHISISILPFVGGPRDARKMATYLSDDISETEEKKLLTLSPGESTIIYSFQSFYSESDISYRWVAFRVNARRFGATFKHKWHMIPLDVMHSHYFGEHDGVNDTMCGILEAKVHWSKAGSILTSISHADTPPYRIENRSQTHYLQLVQDDGEANVFELPPMHSCGYTWDSPLGKKKLRVAVIPDRHSAPDMDRGGKTPDFDSKSTASTVDSDDDSDNEEPDDPLLRSMRKGISTNGLSKTRQKSKRQLLHSRLSRKYNFQKIGKQKDLPCSKLDDWKSNLNKSGESLTVHTRISTGTKVISFNDSEWLANQIEAGLLRRGGDFEGALIDINIEGVGIYFNDNYPAELMGIITRDIQICKPHGSIELIARVRHFQIDAMHPNARYPIIIQPSPMGVDRRKAEIDNTSSIPIIPKSVKTRECYWKLKEEKPIPLLEMTCSYIPQNTKMVWVPNLEVQLCPMKLRVDVEYILRVLSLIFDSVSKYRKGTKKSEGIIHVNENLEYQTRGSMDFCLTYIEQFYIHPVVVELEINIKSDDEDFTDEANLDNTSSSLTLTTISQSTNSEWVSGVMGWLINVGANFAHVAPTYTYSSVHYVDTYSDIIEVAQDVFDYYWMRTIKQCYKVVFSMHLLGDPSLLAHQWKTGVTDLVVKTANEIATGGKDGVGKGVASLFENFVGGTFFAFGRITGSVADTAAAVLTTNLTSDQLKPKSATSNGRNPEHALDGIVQGTEYLAKTVAHGIAGLIGNPYRGIQTGTITGVAKGVSTGVIGLVACPIIGSLGFIAKTSTGVGQTTTLLNLGYIEARCRPRRIVPWGMPMSINGLPYLKGIGIRIHTVRYQNVRKRIINDDTDLNDHNDEDDTTRKERRRIRTAEKRRLNPPSKVVSIKREKDKVHHLSHPIRPKLLSDHPGNLILSHYAVTYEETIELRTSDLQLDDIVSINFWNYKMLKTTTKAKALARCKISVGDMYCHALTFYHEQLKRTEANLAKGVSPAPQGEQHTSQTRMSLILPAPQEYSLFRPLKISKNDRKDVFEAINEEMVAIQKTEEDRIAMFASDSDAESDSSFLNEGKSTDEEIGDFIKKNERLFGSVSLSFFPIPW